MVVVVVGLHLHLGLATPGCRQRCSGPTAAQGSMAHLMRVRFLPEPEVRVIPSRGPGSSGGPPGAGGQGNGKGGRGRADKLSCCVAACDGISPTVQVQTSDPLLPPWLRALISGILECLKSHLKIAPEKICSCNPYLILNLLDKITQSIKIRVSLLSHFRFIICLLL